MVKYKDVYLARNSKAYSLWEDKNFKELDLHIKKCLAEQRALENWPEK